MPKVKHPVPRIIDRMRVPLYTVAGPITTNAHFGFDVPGGFRWVESSTQLLARTNPSQVFRLCIGHFEDWGIPGIVNVPANIEVCLHLTSLDVLQLANPTHPSAQHGALLDWLLQQHPPEGTHFFVLDPDFYVLGNGQISSIARSVSGEVKTAGVGYSSRYSKGFYWDFPVVYFQCFQSHEVWKFNPETTHLTLPAERSAPRALLVSVVKAVRDLIQILEGTSQRVSAARLILSVLLRIPLEVLAQDPEELADTGHVNRRHIGSQKAEVFPQVVRTSDSSFGLDVDSWIRENPGAEALRVPVPWYALRHGIFEKRNFQSQPFLWRFLARIPMRGARGGSMTELVDLRDLGLTHAQARFVCELDSWGVDFYERNGEVLGFHVGSRAKTKLIEKYGNLQSFSEEAGRIWA